MSFWAQYHNQMTLESDLKKQQKMTQEALKMITELKSQLSAKHINIEEGDIDNKRFSFSSLKTNTESYLNNFTSKSQISQNESVKEIIKLKEKNRWLERENR